MTMSAGDSGRIASIGGLADGAAATAEAQTGLGVGRKLGSGAAWTLGGYGVAQVIRFATSMVVTRLLVPELFAIMLIVNTVRTGTELLSDIGIGQSVIRSPRGEEPAFYNTAWTLQVWRGLALFLLCAGLAMPISAIYDIPELRYVLPVAGSTLFLTGFTSMALPLLRRRMSFPRLAGFEVICAVLTSTFQIALAFVYPTVWALVIGLIFGTVVMVAGSFRLKELRHKFEIDRNCASEIMSFGKWITASSAVFFVSMNLDRIYFPAVISLNMLGIFAIARTITDVVNAIFIRLNNSILFPHIASEAARPRHELRKDIGKIRKRFLAVSALAMGSLTASADLLVAILFDHRYHAAGWMASVLTVGIWFAILASSAESSLLGLGRPQAATVSNSAKLIWLIAALPFSVSAYGMIAGVAAISAGDLVRYLATVPHQRRASFSFLLQDAGATSAMVTVIGVLALVRHALGLPFMI